MTRRMWMAMLALVGLFIAAYLTLHAFGFIGQLACSATHGCEIVQSSKWSKLLGIPVAAWGLVYYVIVLTITMIGTQDRHADSRGLSVILVLITACGALFSAWLTYLEKFAIHAWCQWCLSSAAIALLLFILSVIDWRMTPESTPA